MRYVWLILSKHVIDFAVQKFSNVDFLKPLIRAMITKDPSNRPDAEQAQELWRHIRGAVWVFQRGARLRKRGDPRDEAIVFDVVGFLKLGVLLSRRYLMWTAHWLSLLQSYL